VDPIYGDAVPTSGDSLTPPGHPGGQTGQPVTAFYSSHYRPLVRQATVLVHDGATAEDVVQDVFATMQGSGTRPHNSDQALAYLRRSVTNRARSVLRHQRVVERLAPLPMSATPSAEESALVLLERALVIAALETLPARQRQALMLRYYADLSEAEIAAAMGISRGAVKAHTARARASLRTALQTRS
jgi:RNA polymerase sigma-70 factor (sigma-E family)